MHLGEVLVGGVRLQMNQRVVCGKEDVLICSPKEHVATGRWPHHTHCYVESLTKGPNHSSNRYASHHLDHC
jgi:hypothetical protein